MHVGNIIRMLALAAAFVAAAAVGAAPTSAATGEAADAYAACVADSDPSLAYRCGDQPISGMLAFTGPDGRPVLVYCYDDLLVFTAIPDGMGSVIPGGSAVPVRCAKEGIEGMPGYQFTIYTSPTRGWVVDPREPSEASICQNGVTMTVIGMGSSPIPRVTNTIDTNNVCGRQA